jgi:hypothetical protein
MDLKKLSVVLLLAVALIGSACGGGGGDEAGGGGEAEEAADTQTYSENDVTFDYPGDWDEFEAEAAAMSTGSNELWNTTVGPDETNLVNITAYQLNIEVTEDNIADIRAELDGVIGQVVQQAGGEIASGPTQSTVAGFPAYSYEWSDVEVDGEAKDSRAVFLFDGDVEYFFNCQYDADTEEDVLAGCDTILESFEATA